ncbi:hypothetical protein N7499_004522 [Penicillium canescens]|nr:hypothetical protein N7499_004522 [Penicillium canescens]KAJ6161678.1 hypothetical protein N7485_009908 [Penicillium canescens]
MSVIQITTKKEFDELVKCKSAVALQAKADWSGPCKAISPVFNKHDQVYTNDSLTFARFETDDVADLAQELSISNILAFLFFEEGEKCDSVVRANPSAPKDSIQKLHG